MSLTLTVPICEHCKEQTKMLMRTKLRDKKYVCNKCTKVVPNMMKESMKKNWDYETFTNFMNYYEYQKNELQPKFMETNCYGIVHLDVISGLFYIDDSFFREKFILQLQDIKLYDFYVQPKEYKEGIFGGSIKADVIFFLLMDMPSWSYVNTISYDVHVKAKRRAFTRDISYAHPNDLMVFEMAFYGALASVTSKDVNEVCKNKDKINLAGEDGDELEDVD